MRSEGLLMVLAASTLLAAACSPPDDATSAAETRLGPLDGTELSAVELERVGVGDTAPDFRLAALGGDVVQLSDFRGSQDVVLVFYRGHW